MVDNLWLKTENIVLLLKFLLFNVYDTCEHNKIGYRNIDSYNEQKSLVAA